MHKIFLGLIIISTFLPSCSTNDIVQKKREAYLQKEERSNNAFKKADKLHQDLNKELWKKY